MTKQRSKRKPVAKVLPISTALPPTRVATEKCCDCQHFHAKRYNDGTCKRYPQPLLKRGDDGCGEFRPRPAEGGDDEQITEQTTDLGRNHSQAISGGRVCKPSTESLTIVETVTKRP